MNENTEYFKVKSPKIKLRTPQYTYVRLLLIYTCIYIAAFLLGCLLFHSAKINEGQKSIVDISYFIPQFPAFDNVFSFAAQSVALAQRDLTDALVLSLAGFTLLAGVTIFCTLALRGFSFGFAINCFAYTLRADTTVAEHPVLSVFLFSCLSAGSTAILLHQAAKSAIFTDDFKALGGRPRKIIRSKALYAHVFRFFVAAGVLLCISLLRCFI